MISFFESPFLGAVFDIGTGARVVAHADQDEGVQCVVRGAVAAADEAVAVGASRRG